jgi:hypothetical protein
VHEYEAQPDVAIGGRSFARPNWKCRLVTEFAVPLFNRIDRANPSGPHPGAPT